MTTRTTFNGASTDVPWPNTGMPEGFGDQYARLMRTLFHAAALPLTSVGGTANVITASLDPVLDGDGLVDGMRFGVTWAAANTGAVTLALNGGAAVSVRDAYGAVLVAGRLQPGRRDLLEYIGGYFRIINSDATADMVVALAAFAAGGAGQPRIEAAAFPDFAVGAVEVINFFGAGIVNSRFASASGSSSGTSASGGITEYVALKAGTLRLSVEGGRTGSSITSCNILLKKNGTQIAAIAVSTGSYVTYTADFSFVAGDVIAVEYALAASGVTGSVSLSYRNLRLLGDKRGIFRI